MNIKQTMNTLSALERAVTALEAIEGANSLDDAQEFAIAGLIKPLPDDEPVIWNDDGEGY
ncbi:hypothetical protein XV62_003176 [Escherichia coli]|nr:hypothetical protein [Escherichia coli]EFL5600510.1 hypothetical protein [Escherichia coli]EGK5685453.1 hypothetical protein [Escherichia coli]